MRNPTARGAAIFAAAVVVLVAIVMVLAACGAEDPAEPTSGAAAPAAPSAPASPTSGGAATSSFARDADEICADHARSVEAIGARLGVPSELGSDQQAYDRARAQASAAQLRELERLSPPSADAAQFAALLSNHREYASLYEQAVPVADGSDAARYRELTSQRLRLGQAQVELSADLGLQACSRTLPPEVAEEVRTVVERVFTGADPEGSCERDVTPAFIDSNLSGSLTACREILEGLATDGATVEFVRFNGVDEVVASAVVRFSTEQGKPPRDLTYDLTWNARGNQWRLNSAFDPQSVR